MRQAFESAEITNVNLRNTLQKMLIPQDVFATTNYDTLLEKATGLGSLSYEEPNVAFQMLDQHRSRYILHIHGIYDSTKKKDNIIADEAQYRAVMEDQGAQFIQGILGTRTVIFVGCGKTGEDANISRFIRFAVDKLKMDKRYFFLYRDGETFLDMSDNITLIPYGDSYDDLPGFLEDMAQLRLKTKILDAPLVGLSPYQNVASGGNVLQQYHYSMQTVPFCGRTAELAALKEFVFQDKDFSWWAVTGQAGAGKSRLALELLRQLPTSWFGFFLNDKSGEKDVESFAPFSDTLVVVDYVAGRERIIANLLHSLRKQFDGAAYRLRVLLLEWENERSSASWYGKLLQRYGRFDTEELKEKEYRASFLYIGDLDDAVTCFIGKICEIRGFDIPESLQEELHQEYAQKNERLQFRPLFVQIFVEAWLENGFIMPKYDRFEDLLRIVMEKEQRRWIETLDGDQGCCNAMIRLLLRANICGKMSEDDILAYYQEDWKLIQQFLKKHSFPGRQFEEQKQAMIAAVCHSLHTGGYEIEPMYPDLIKEYMFFFYADKETLPDVLRELWQNDARKFSVFITRCRMDFPKNPFYEHVLRIYDANTQDMDVLAGRMNLLKKYEIDKKDDPGVLLDIIDNEYTFWKNVCPQADDPETQEKIACMKLMGLSLVAKQYGGWSYYDLSQMMEVIRELFQIPGGQAVQILKQIEGQRISTDLSANGFISEATEVIQMMDSIQSETPQFTAYIRMLNKSTEMMNALMEEELPRAFELLKEMRNSCIEIEEYEVFLYSCRNILMFCTTALTNTQVRQVMDYVEQVSALFPGEKDIYAKAFACKILELQYYFLSGEQTADTIQNQLQQYVLDCSLSDFEDSKKYAEAMGVAWATKETFQLNFTDREETHLTSVIDRAQRILQVNPHLTDVVFIMIQAQRALYKNVLKRRIRKQDVEMAFSYVEENPESETVREAFFAMLEESEERNRIRAYLAKPLVTNAIRDARYNPLSDGGIPEIAQQAALLQELLMKATPCTNRRSVPKVGANAPCPCGSGKKFKKCCRGKGIYD